MGFLQIFVPALLGFTLIATLVKEAVIRVGEYERLVVYRLGHPVAVRGPGRHLLIPLLERGSTFDIRDDFNARLIADYEAQVGAVE